MQRQKTIAKWLAIILLLTIALTCYLIISTMLKNKNAPTYTPVEADTSANYEPLSQPSYSEFPREATALDDKYVINLGGSEKETFVDSIYFEGKRIVFFYSQSTCYDVQNSGLHMAILNDLTLTDVVSIGDVEYVLSSIVNNGLLLITKSQEQTHLVIYNSQLKTVCRNTCLAYKSYKLLITSNEAVLYATDNNYVYRMNLSPSLEIDKSNFVYPCPRATIFEALKFGGKDFLFLQSDEGAQILTFDVNRGFICKNSMSNCVLRQLLPLSSDGNPIVVALLENGENSTILSFDEALNTLAQKTLSGIFGAVMLKDNNNILLVTSKKKYSFCSHLELQSETLISEQIAGGKCYAVNGIYDMFLCAEGGEFRLVKITDDAYQIVFSASGDNVKIVVAQSIYVMFDGDKNCVADLPSSLCFGDDDVYIVKVRMDI